MFNVCIILLCLQKTNELNLAKNNQIMKHDIECVAQLDLSPG